MARNLVSERDDVRIEQLSAEQLKEADTLWHKTIDEVHCAALGFTCTAAFLLPCPDVTK
jgi:hypothetical protein